MRAVSYVIAVVVFLEIVFRVALSRPDVLDRIFVPVDSASWRLRWVDRHGGGMDLTYGFDVPHPTRGWALRPNVRQMPVFDHKILSSNSQGVRGATEYTDDRPPGVARIVALGDSFTFGEEVSDGEAYPAVLADLLPGVEVLNLGVHGYGHDQMLLYFREEGRRYHPNLVLIGFVYADAFRNVMDFKDYAKPRFVLAGDRLVLVNGPIPPPADLLRADRWHPRLLDVSAMLLTRYRSSTGELQRNAERVTLALLDAIAAEARNAEAVPVFVDLAIAGPFADAGEQLLAPWCASHGYRCVATGPALAAAAARGEVLTQRGHWSPAGHRVVAGVIRDYVVSSKLFVPAG